jgi:hypothetical protein
MAQRKTAETLVRPPPLIQLRQFAQLLRATPDAKPPP